MHEPLSAEKTAELQKEFPVDEAPAKLTRAQKMERLASLIDKLPPGECLALDHLLERRSDDDLASRRAQGALALAASDDVFKKDGLKAAADSGVFSAKDVRDYLELSTPELHEFSCDCGGGISNSDMARRVRSLATPRPGLIGRVRAAAGF